MNKAEKAVEQAKLDREKAVLKELESHYEYALKGINERLRVLQAAPETQSNVYHIQYQKTMQKQVADILANLRANEYNTIDQYMHDAYTTGYVGTMYSLHNQGMPLTIPINQDAVVKAVQHNTKLTSPLYDELGIDTRKMQKNINRELSRGLSSGLTYDEIARNIRNTTKAPLARAKLIARTEGHRIHEESSYDAAVAAKAEGADLVKQWDATLDGDTRPNHKQLDTQIRELEEPFEVGTFKPMHPGDFGTAGEDCNCRCVSLKRARWALDEAELEEMKERAKQFGLDKSDEFAEFEKKYLKASEEEGKTAPVPQKADDAKPTQQPGGKAVPAAKNTPAKTPQTIENSGESGIMEVELDGLVPCLEDAKTGERFDTTVHKITDRSALRQFNEKNGWFIDWNRVPQDCTVCALTLKNDDAVQGMVAYRIDHNNSAAFCHWVVSAPHNRGKDKQFTGVGGHLFAVIADASEKAGYGGFLYGQATSKEVLEYYKDVFGATQLDGLRFFIDEEAAHRILETYNFDREDE